MFNSSSSPWHPASHELAVLVVVELEYYRRQFFIRSRPPSLSQNIYHDWVAFGKGAIGHARSESRSTFVSKLMHEHLAAEARQGMWAGKAKGSVTRGCGCVLGWTAPDEVSRLQWHVLECGLPGEAAIRTRWHTAVRAALSKRIKRRDVVDDAMAC